MRIYPDATTLLALGGITELDLLTNFDGELRLLPAVREEVTSEPARTSLERFVDREAVVAASEPSAAALDDAKSILGETAVTGDVQLVAAVVDGETVAVVSDDRRVRTTADGLGARVTGTIGVVVRAVAEGLPAGEGRELVRRLDSRGLHMTGDLRETADELIRAAAAERAEGNANGETD